MRWIEALTLAGLLGASGSALGSPELSASMGCALEAGTGRLLCTVTLSPPADAVLSWSDAVVVRAPPSAHALRSRVASARGTPERIVIGFVLTEGGGGAIEVRARAVSCPKIPRRGACEPSTRLVRYELVRPGG